MLNKILEHRRLASAKPLLTFDIKDPGDIGACPGFDFGIGVDEGTIQYI
jgi:hypothetical protein